MKNIHNETKLTSAQQREYQLILQHQAIAVYSPQRRKVIEKLVEKGLVTEGTDGWWFYLKTEKI